MIFITLTNELINRSENKRQKNGTILVEIDNSPPPLAKHYIYAPINDDAKRTIMGQFKHIFPAPLLELYSSYNGFDMFWEKKEISVRRKTIFFPFSCFTCYGVPHDARRDPEALQPFDIRLENLRYPDGIPDNWLKFGACTLQKNNDISLWIHTDSHEIYATPSNLSSVVASWKSLDDCLCEIFKSLINADLSIGQ